MGRKKKAGKKAEKKADTVILENLPQAAQMEVAAMTAPITETLRKYFRYVFREEYFAIGLDVTGVYLFTEEGTDDEIACAAAGLKSDLQLEDEEVSVCVVGRESRFNYVSKKMLVKYVIQALSSRKAVLTNQDLEEILSVYGISSKIRLGYRDYGNTELFQVIKLVYKEHNYDVDEEAIIRVCQYRPATITKIVECGIPTTFAAEILECLGKENIQGAPDECDSRPRCHVEASTQVQEVHRHLSRFAWVQVAFLALFLAFCFYRGWIGCIATGLFAYMFNRRFCKLITFWKIADLGMMVLGAIALGIDFLD